MANMHMKICLTSLIIREMQINNTMKYHLIPVRITITKKSTNHKSWKGCGEEGILLQCWWKCKFGAATMENCREVFQKIELPYDPAIPLGAYSGQNYNLKKCMHLYVNSSTIYNIQDMKTT